MKLSIVIPAYNESKRLPPSLEEIYKWLKKQGREWEIVIVDDGSTDDILKRLRELKKKIRDLKIISYKPNKGKGYATRKGMLAAQGDIIIFTDADLSTPIKEAEKIIKELKKGADVVIGSRFTKGAEVLATASPMRNFMAKVFNRGVKVLLLYGPRDTQCGFKGFKKQSVRKIFKNIKSNSVLYDLEIFLLARKYGFKIVEIPVIWKHDPDSRLTYNLKKSLAVWLELFRLKILYKIIFPVRVVFNEHG